ncbi:MAG: OmpH family outer membrane protein [Candidatus Saccharicenans sp.]
MNTSRQKKNQFLWLLLFCGLLTLPLTAQSRLKVAVVDSQKAFDQSLEGKKAVAVLQEREEQIKSELKRRDEEIKNLRQKLASQELTLSPEARKKLQQEIDRKEAERLKYEQENSRDFEQLKSQIIKRIREEMLAVVDEIIKEQGYELVFDLSTSGLIYYHPELDITQEVIKRYDASKSTKK